MLDRLKDIMECMSNDIEPPWEDIVWLINTVEQLEEELTKVKGVALHWQGQSSYWENQYFNKEY